MRIGFFADMYLPVLNGVGISVDTFRRSLEEMGHEVFVLAPKPSFRYKEADSHIIRFPAVKGLWFEDYMTKWPWTPANYKKVRELNLDIIHTHSPAEMGVFGLSAAFRYDIPVVTTYHTDLFEYVKHYPKVFPGVLALTLAYPVIVGQPEHFRTAFSMMRPEKSIDDWNQKVVVKMLTLIHNHYDAVVAPSEKMKSMLASWGTKTRIEVIPTGVMRLPSISSDRDRIRNYLGISTDQIMLFNVSRLSNEKNIMRLLESFTIVHKKHPEAQLVLVGQGEDEESYRKWVQDKSLEYVVTFAGVIPHDELGAYYDACDIYVFPSKADTQGLVLHEAAAAEKPVVMIDKSITPIMKDHESCLVAKDTSKDFAKKISDLITNSSLRERMGKKAAKLAGLYSPLKQASQLVRLYEDVIKYHKKFDQ